MILQSPPGRYEHGTRAKYALERCRCFPCRLANADYETARQNAQKRPWRVHYTGSGRTWVVRHRDTAEISLTSDDRAAAFARRDALNAPHLPHPDNQLVDARRARNYLRRLSRNGVGYKRAADLSGLGHTPLFQILNGQTRRIKRATEAAILAVRVSDRAPGALVDAAPTWELLNRLLADGYTKAGLACALGRKSPALQIRQDRIKRSTADQVASLFETLAGKKSPDVPEPAASITPKPKREAFDFEREGRQYLLARIAAGEDIDRRELAEITGFTVWDNTALIESVRAEVRSAKP